MLLIAFAVGMFAGLVIGALIMVLAAMASLRDPDVDRQAVSNLPDLHP